MKTIDIRSFIIGVLFIAILFIVGFKNQSKNLGDIEVRSIKIVDDNGDLVGLWTGNMLFIVDENKEFATTLLGHQMIISSVKDYSQPTIVIGEYYIEIFYSNGDERILLSQDNSGGFLKLYNNKNINTVYLGSDIEKGGFLLLSNDDDNLVASISVNEKKGGTILLLDEDLNLNWYKSGTIIE